MKIGIKRLAGLVMGEYLNNQVTINGKVLTYHPKQGKFQYLNKYVDFDIKELEGGRNYRKSLQTVCDRINQGFGFE